MKRQINEIQILRAVAALALLFFHVEREMVSIVMRNLFFLLIERPIYCQLKARLAFRKTTEVAA
jgi:peptidoglycan/LPS O-acetylase OafA/YrhL